MKSLPTTVVASLCLLLYINPAAGQATDHKALAQDTPFPFKARNAIYLELLGSNELYSINYDRIVAASPKNWLFGYRVGGSLAGKSLVRSRLIGEVYTLLGQHKSHLELGISSSLGRNFDYNRLPYGGPANLFISPVIAYRLQEPRGPSCFRVSFSPFFRINNQESGRNGGFFIGLGFGRSF